MVSSLGSAFLLVTIFQNHCSSGISAEAQLLLWRRSERENVFLTVDELNRMRWVCIDSFHFHCLSRHRPTAGKVILLKQDLEDVSQKLSVKFLHAISVRSFAIELPM